MRAADTWLATFVIFVFFVILCAKAPKAPVVKIVVSSSRRCRAKRNRVQRKEA
jgi:hypothetical protein